jgi:mono/diheme cytochrome c family protein
MKPLVKKILIGLGALLGTAVLGGGGYVYAQVSAFDASMDKVYDVPLPAIARSEDPEAIARGKHLVSSLGGCAVKDCHGADLAGGQLIDIGPVGAIEGPNITPGGMLLAYSDAELARLLRTGVKKDGRSIRMMPVQDFYWLPDSDLTAIISYLRTVPTSEKPNGATRVGVIGKVLDRRGEFPWDIARFVEGLPKETPPSPAPTAEYGRFVVKLCSNCHGEGLSGGPLPGAPPDFPVPLNITPHETGLAGWTFDDFEKLLRQGIRKNGQPVDPFMAVEATKNMDDTEMRALWAHLEKVPPKPFGGR